MAHTALSGTVRPANLKGVSHMEQMIKAKVAGILVAIALAAGLVLGVALGGPGGRSAETPGGGGGGYEVFVP